MTEFAGIFEVLASDQSDARLASRKALVLSRDRIDARLGKFLAASKSAEEFDARYDLVAEDFAGIVRVAADEIGHDDPDSLIVTLHDHYRTAGKPPWLEDDDDSDNDGDDSEKPKSKKDKKKDKKDKDSDDSDDDDDDSLEFAAKTADAVPLVQAAYIEPASGSGEDNLTEHERQLIQAGRAKIGPNGIFQLINPDMHTPPGKKSSLHIADKGNTGLSGPSPKMDKKRWTPKSVKPIDVPSERHPTVQKDVMEIMPKENLTGPAHDMDEINALTTVETLPTGTGLDDAGFAGNNQDMAPHTKTFGDGGQTDPVKSESLEA
jgi:hypothetical protein